MPTEAKHSSITYANPINLPTAKRTYKNTPLLYICIYMRRSFLQPSYVIYIIEESRTSECINIRLARCPWSIVVAYYGFVVNAGRRSNGRYPQTPRDI